MWCVGGAAVHGARSFTHPPGLSFIGRDARHILLPVPKAGSSTLRHWNKQVFTEQQRAAVAAGRPGAAGLLMAAHKPHPDRCAGAGLLDEIAPAVRDAAVAFAVVRDPLLRFCSGWLEIRGSYGQSEKLRPWGLRALRLKPFFADLAAEPQPPAHCGPGDGAAAPEAHALAAAVLDLACGADWNEHLTPQPEARFIPEGFLGPGSVVAPLEALATVLLAAAAAANLSNATAHRFAQTRVNVRGGEEGSWPRPADVELALRRVPNSHPASLYTPSVVTFRPEHDRQSGKCMRE